MRRVQKCGGGLLHRTPTCEALASLGERSAHAGTTSRPMAAPRRACSRPEELMQTAAGSAGSCDAVPAAACGGFQQPFFDRADVVLLHGERPQVAVPLGPDRPRLILSGELDTLTSSSDDGEASDDDAESAADAGAGGLGALLSPSAMHLRAMGEAVLFVSKWLPSGLEGAQSWGLSDFHIVKDLYQGYASTVCAGFHKASNTAVALKVYDMVGLPTMLQYQLYREVDVHSRQHHPHILQLYAAFVEEQQLVLVLEHASGGDLAGMWRKIGQSMPEQRVASRVMVPLLQALSSIHGRSIAHRDIKPANILFTVREGHVSLKLADFGAAIDMSAEAAVTRTGTGPYMAPEVNRNPLKHAAEDNKLEAGLQYNQAVDIWSLGVMAYELLVGLRPDVDALRRVADAALAANFLDRTRSARRSMGDVLPGTGSPAPRNSATRLHAINAQVAALLPFPKCVPPAARDFVLAALRPLPEERPSAAQLLGHPWIACAAAAPAR